MIKIQKENTVVEVTKGVYENIFKDLGYNPVCTKTLVKEDITPKVTETSTVIDTDNTKKTSNKKSLK